MNPDTANNHDSPPPPMLSPNEYSPLSPPRPQRQQMPDPLPTGDREPTAQNTISKEATSLSQNNKPTATVHKETSTVSQSSLDPTTTQDQEPPSTRNPNDPIRNQETASIPQQSLDHDSQPTPTTPHAPYPPPPPPTPAGTNKNLHQPISAPALPTNKPNSSLPAETTTTEVLGENP